ncbi:hypothetical protein [Natronoglycomyces albus]|uniref:Uncharacterized protein n=1 Tax=Natronoglycomyces albus TaxID=2811108 RepID=A0A895XNN8_9ACTN|nr:hypothetical protein [Natronoglycomyces albus]QSB03910.1 hypothetical protein JQS30_08730 [Natronoglycomyces albus]
MRSAATVWGRVAEADVALSQAVVNGLQPLSDWAGRDGDTCRAKVDDFAAAVHGLASECSGIQRILSVAQVLAELIKETIKWLLSELIKYFVAYIAPQLLIAPFTFGATAATATATATVQAAQTTSKGAKLVQQMISAFTKLKSVMVQFATEALPGIAIAALQSSVGAADGGTRGHGDASQLAGSNESVHLDPAALHNAKPLFEMIAEDASGVADVVGEASVDDMTWGMCGLIGFVMDYETKVAEIDDLHRASSRTMAEIATKIDDMAGAWEETDKALAGIFDDFDLSLD